MPGLRFDDAVVLVTGGAQGIGLETARRFILGGASVWIADVVEASLMNAAAELGSQVRPFHGDLSDSSSRSALMAQILSESGRLNVLVNNAGPPTADPAAHEDFVSGVARSLGMYGAMCRLSVPLLSLTPGSAIVNVASIAGMVGLGSDWYAAAKAGVIGLTVRLAVELGPLGIRVNAVAPGVIDTPRTAHLTAPARASLTEAVPLGQIGTARNVADAITFLSSDLASYISGSTVKVDGGLSCRPAWAGSQEEDMTSARRR